MSEINIHFRCSNLMLEGRLSLPEGDGPFPVVVVCHPHPLYGGSMDNNVVNGICDALMAASIISFKFNFRGVGGSEGTHDNGNGEQQDVYAAIDFVAARDEIDPDKIGLAGYSAGAGYALSTGINDKRIKAVVAVSPPLAMFDFTPLKNCPKPKLLLSGGKDEYTPVVRFLDFCRGISYQGEYYINDSADHFWWGHESRLGKKVAEYFLDIFENRK